MKTIDMIKKDLKIILGDRKALATMILMPIILTTILSFALGGTFNYDSNDTRIQVAIVKKYNKAQDIKRFNGIVMDGIMGDYIDKEQSNEIINGVSELDIESIFFTDFLGNEDIMEILDYSVESEAEAMELIANGKVAAIIMLPENFIYDMNINFFTPFRNEIDIKVLGHPDKYIDHQIVEQITEGFSNIMSSMIISKNVFIETAMEEDLGMDAYKEVEDILKGMETNSENIGVNINYIKVKGKKHISSFDYYSVAMTTMFILFAAAYGSRMLLEEKDNLTYHRMIMAGTPKWKIVAGKYFTIFFFALIQISIMVLYSSIILKVDWGNMILVALISLCSVLAVAGVGTMVGAITYRVGNYKMASVFETAIIQAMALLGGSFFPINILPEFMQKLSIISLNGNALKAYIRIMMGYGLQEIIPYLLILLGMGIGFTLIAIKILSKEMRWKDAQHNQAKITQTA